MFKKLVLGLMVALLALSIISLPTLAQDPDDGAASKDEVLPESGDGNTVEQVPPRIDPPPGDSGRGQSLLPPGEMPPVDLSNLTLPDGQVLPNPEALKQQHMAFVNSLTAEQRAQIRGVLDANKPAYLDQFKSAMGNPQESGRAAELSREQLQALDQPGRQWAASANAAIKAVLSPEQSAAFDSILLPHPAEWSSGLAASDITPQTQNDCYNAYYYNYYYVNYYAYYMYLYGLYAYMYEDDPYNLSVMMLSIDTYTYSYWAYQWSYYAYYYYSSYTYQAYYYSTHTTGLALYGYQLANTAATWTGSGSYSDYAGYYGYLTYYWSENYGDYYAYYCYAG